ncbi:MAG: hypothetical protein ACE5GS_01290 [Kiloniellaceae bacterium]
MNVSRWRGLMLTVAVSLGLLMPEAVRAAAPALGCDRVSSPDICCDCCVVCDEFGIAGACPVFCVATLALATPVADLAVPPDRASPRADVDIWICHARPPDPAPPKRTAFI